MVEIDVKKERERIDSEIADLHQQLLQIQNQIRVWQAQEQQLLQEVFERQSQLKLLDRFNEHKEEK